MTINDIAVIVVSAAIAAAWVPVGIHFWKSWKNRGSPLSLAICLLVAYPIFTNLSSAIFLNNSRMNSVLTMVGTNLLILLNFLFCFRWQKERFPEARSRPSRSSTPPDFWAKEHSTDQLVKKPEDDPGLQMPDEKS